MRIIREKNLTASPYWKRSLKKQTDAKTIILVEMIVLIEVSYNLRCQEPEHRVNAGIFITDQ